MRTKIPSNMEKARLVIQAKNAFDTPDPADEPKVRKLSKAPQGELNELYRWAKGAMSAMRWNTATLGIGTQRISFRTTR